ncbi:MAG: primosomal protein N' [Nitrospira sp.]|nr:primosomal protein N' [Nitrospira sp.]MDH4370747.1 primosomal protein N' [Nitrospira sp.]
MNFDGNSTAIRRTDRLYADVIVPRHISKSFTYLVPPTLAQAIDVGSRVLVPFGRAALEGAVISLTNELPTEIKTVSLREISSLVQDGQDPLLSPKLLELSRKIANYYVAPWGQCLRLIFSSFVTRQPSRTRYVVTPQGRVALATGHCPDNLRPTLQRIARRTNGILSSTLHPTRRGDTLRIIDILIKESWLALVPLDTPSADHRRRPGKLVAYERDDGLPMNAVLPSTSLPDSDLSWRARVIECLQSNHMQKLVLHAPWPHRIRRLADAIQQAHSLKRSTIVVTGEIARATWLKQWLSTLTGLQITLAHSSLESDRLEQSQGLMPSVVVGTRSAIFAPIESIGLIWIEGEEDAALKEPQEPRYHAREVASLRAESEQALLILASAKPSLESKFDATAEHHYVSHDVALQPKIELVDLRKEPGGTLFSHKLISAMQEALGNHRTILLFLNRKGYARTLVCRDCSWVPRCAACAVPFTYYREVSQLTCRYCGRSDQVPDSCPSCHSSRMSPIGDGTERVETDTRRLFPQAKIARIDGDTLRRPASARQLWESARSGAWDILIGTQALFRREPLPHYGLVGILQADSGLHVSDFRSAEQTYQLLIDAASVASPASVGGRVIVQTRFPTHHAVQALLSGDPDRFYEEERAARQLLYYPPLCHIAELSVIGKSLEIVEEAAKRWATELSRSAHDQESLIVLGPVPALNRQPRNHQHRMLVKAADCRTLSRRVHDSVQNLEQQYRRGQIKFAIDIDPVETG